jgi:hypothetical protein
MSSVQHGSVHLSRQPSVIGEHHFSGVAPNYFCFGLQPLIKQVFRFTIADSDFGAFLRVLD